MPRINLLKENEIVLFDSPPQFTDEERLQFFALPAKEENLIFKQIHTKIGYILQEGYFKSQQKFFLPSQYYEKDIEYVISLCGVKRYIDIKKLYNKFAYNRWKLFILDKYTCSPFFDCKFIFEKEAQELVKSSLNPKEIFYALVDFLVNKKIEVPSYYLFAEVITNALNSFENELIKIVDSALTTVQKELLDWFMYLPVDSSLELSAKNPYLITHLKKVEQAISPLKIRESLNDFLHIRELHKELSDFYTSNLLSNELINYYAVWILKAKHIQFDAIRDIRNKRLYLVSFISYQYKIRQDYFVDTFLEIVRKFYNDTQKNADLSLLRQDLKLQKQESLVKIRRIVSGKDDLLNKIREITYSKNDRSSDERMELIKEVFNSDNFSSGKKILDELDKLENTGIKNLKDQLFYEELNKIYKRLTNRVGRILQILEFNPHGSNSEVYEAIRHYQFKGGKVNEERAPIGFINKDDGKYLYSEDGKFNSSLYKIFLYKAVFDGIKSGTLNLLFSERYKSIDDYMIPLKHWEDNKTKLIERAGLADLYKNSQETIVDWKNLLSKHYKITNQNIQNNEHIKFNPNGTAKVRTPKSSDSEEGSTAEFIGRDKLIPLSQILSNIIHYVDYISSFSHYNRKNAKSIPSERVIYAAIIALGCNIEIRKMGRISEGIGADILEYTVRWFFSKNNIDEANRKVIALINSIPLSEIYLDHKNQVNTSSDGQKYNVGVPSLQARHSSKYFGMGKGVYAYGSVDAKGRSIFGRVNSLQDRESNYVVDALTHNEDVISDTHTTDSHGYTEIVFGVCNLLGVDFIPRIKNYHEQILYTFKEYPRKLYENQKYKILPAKGAYINEKIIIEQWDQVLRFLCTINLRETLPSNILKRLSSYSRQHPFYKALKEIGRIYKTAFLLRYYDELPLRQDIEKQLNRIELTNLFSKAVFFGGNQEFHYATKEEQDIALGCRQLIQNAIVLWNYLYISEKLTLIEDISELQKQINSLKNSSIMTWQHVNMHGKYDFNSDSYQIPFNLNKIKSLIINQI